ncbi:MAG: restriction endonuclease [Proteobacteria bacterium]|nr:MAG: restriction endonuclease [Pseudomonadota bacterium]
MKAWVGVTDWSWYEFLANQPRLEEVNFWQPGGSRAFTTIGPGELFLFKLRRPHDVIAGGGFFAHSALLPLGLAWESFGTGNGAASLADMKRLIDRYRSSEGTSDPNYTIGCVVLVQPFFLPRSRWIPAPPDWKPNIVQGKTYDLTTEPGLSIFEQVRDALTAPSGEPSWPVLLRDLPADPRERYGEPVLVRPRLGQGTFRVLVTDAYDRKCALSSEKVLPVLEAAHIRPYVDEGPHRVDNGILLRSDLHILFDRGYLTVTPGHRVEVSRRIHEEFDNGREYHALHGQDLRLPHRQECHPSREFLSWHNDNVYRG